jgi:hypothetical protein
MPEQDFELYLSLLSRFLRLKSTQRDEIADELRDHLEARQAELAAHGLSGEEAIRSALDEFGDAAELANHFTRVSHIRKRRLIMRVTFGTITALATSLLVATAFWPETKQAAAPQRAVAQESLGASQPKQPADLTVVTPDEMATVEAKLSKPIGTVPEGFQIGGLPLADALEFLGERLDLDIIIDQAAIADAQIDTNSLVQLHVKRTKLTGRVALDLVLEPLHLSYMIRDGLIRVTTVEQANQIQVYNIRDLLPNLAENFGGGAAIPGMVGGRMGGGMMGGRGRPGMKRDMEQAMQRMSTNMLAGMGGGEAAGPGGGFGGGMGGISAIRETNSLAELIAATIDPESWDYSGGHGSVIQYHELLVVKNSQAVHGKIKALLEMMRTSAQGDSGAAAPGRAAPQARQE